MKLYAGIEGGGTKFVTIVTNENNELVDQIKVPTTTPSETLGKTFEFLDKFHSNGELFGIGITCFGPLDLNKSSKTFGSILSTPKPGWANCPIYNFFHQRYGLPIQITTDVNGSALAEGTFGGARDLSNYIYITVGTGIGIGVILNGKVVQGHSHFEAGHMLIPRAENDGFTGICPFHGNCLEGLASGPAIKERWKVKSALYLPPDHAAWELEAEYISYALTNLILCYSPERIILGGGVMKQTQLLDRIRNKTAAKLNKYTTPQLYENPNDFIILQQLHDISGAYGASLLAQQAENKSTLTGGAQ